MLNKKPVLPGKQCSHSNCRSTCHVVSNAKPRTPLKRTPIKKVYKPKEVKIEGLNAWYLARSKEMTGKCQNCNKPSSARSSIYWRWSVCHILPKSLFPSVATHPLNNLELCISCHSQFDSNWLTASKMPIFLKAKHRFELFVENIDWQEVRRIPKELTT